MPAGKHDITIEQGALFTMKLMLRAAPVAPATVGLPLDLTNHVFKGQIRPKFGAEDVWADFVFNVLNQSMSATKGMVVVTIPSTVTRDIPIKKEAVGVYDIESTVVSGETERWLSGSATISPEVTLT